MKTATVISIICMGSLVACQNTRQGEHKQANDTLIQSDNILSSDQEQKYCFLRTEGTHQQDSSYLQLVIRNETVNGTYNVIPHEKDARRGTILGEADDGILDLVWTFTQEGIQDTLRVVFMLQDGKILQKPLTLDTLTGRQMTSDDSDFSEVYEQVDCVPHP